MKKPTNDERNFLLFLLTAGLFLFCCVITSAVLTDVGGYTKTAQALFDIGSLGFVLLMFSLFLIF